MHESTCTYSPVPYITNDHFDGSGSGFRPSSSFRVLHWEANFDEETLEEKTIEISQNDLHIELPGKWEYTLYPDIYGLPESFMSLLSQTIRLANER
jgi:arginine metabolism regulation protein II